MNESLFERSEEMIIVTNVEYITVPRSPYEIYKKYLSTPDYYTSKETYLHDQEVTVNTEVFKELINGRRFCRPSDGLDIIVGVDKKSQDILGLQYEAWDNMQKDYEIISRRCSRKEKEFKMIDKELDKYNNATFIDRLKFLFKGKL